MYVSQRDMERQPGGTGTRLATPPGRRRRDGLTAKESRYSEAPLHSTTVIRSLVATCPANGTGPREAPLITASGEGFIYHSTLLHLAHFLPSYTAHTSRATLRIPSILHTSVTVQQRQKLPGTATLLEAFFSLPCPAVNKGRLVSSLSPTQLPPTLRVPLALSYGRTWPADAVIRIKPRSRSS